MGARAPCASDSTTEHDEVADDVRRPRRQVADVVARDVLDELARRSWSVQVGGSRRRVTSCWCPQQDGASAASASTSPACARRTRLRATASGRLDDPEHCCAPKPSRNHASTSAASVAGTSTWCACVPARPSRPRRRRRGRARARARAAACPAVSIQTFGPQTDARPRSRARSRPSATAPAAPSVRQSASTSARKSTSAGRSGSASRGARCRSASSAAAASRSSSVKA